MNYSDFSARVQEYTGLEKKDVGGAVKAVLETFGKLLSRQHRKHLSAQLPGELKIDLKSKKEAELFSLEDFYGRVAARTRLRFHDGTKLTHGVLRALSESVAEGEIKDILGSLPPEYREVFEKGPGHSSAVDTHPSGSDRVKGALR